MVCAQLVVTVLTKKKKKKQVSYDEGKAVADRNNLLFFEVSAKDATNVNKSFEQMIIGEPQYYFFLLKTIFFFFFFFLLVYFNKKSTHLCENRPTSTAHLRPKSKLVPESVLSLMPSKTTIILYHRLHPHRLQFN